MIYAGLALFLIGYITAGDKGRDLILGAMSFALIMALQRESISPLLVIASVIGYSCAAVILWNTATRGVTWAIRKLR